MSAAGFIRGHVASWVERGEGGGPGLTPGKRNHSSCQQQRQTKHPSPSSCNLPSPSLRWPAGTSPWEEHV
ncbi:hypothetical protein Y1Q_0014795 [Alligator mississippiensis]|uniref:Uncharacterized protein n=1 Tax=Alligator mississippiensis TaxID=8496 RepID=A0A151M1Y2_ALLMI|nr:hypothetical protein Y1Q_0014795 [Alligator mississippiensis]